jgi:hypothetical protein
MPHSKKLMKQTGDTHPPEVEFDLGRDRDRDDEPELGADDGAQARVYADGYVPAPEPAAGSLPQPSVKPSWMMLGAVLAAGFVLARLLRR